MIRPVVLSGLLLLAGCASGTAASTPPSGTTSATPTGARVKYAERWSAQISTVRDAADRSCAKEKISTADCSRYVDGYTDLVQSVASGLPVPQYPDTHAAVRAATGAVGRWTKGGCGGKSDVDVCRKALSDMADALNLIAERLPLEDPR